MATFSIAFVAACFLGMGLLGLAAPAKLIAPFGITLPTPEARAEVRAVYGGFGVAIALLLALHTPELRPGVLCTTAAALFGMAFGRLCAHVLGDKPTRFYPGWFYFWFELVAAGMLIAAR